MAPPGSASAPGPRSVAVAGNITNSVIVTGDHATVQVRVDGQDALLAQLLGGGRLPRRTPRPPPLDAVPPPSPEHLDRQSDAAAVLAGVQAGRPVEVSGEADIGKTFVVTHVLAEDAARTLPHGAVYVFAKGKTFGEVLQELFDAFFDCEPPYVEREQAIRQALRDKQALVVVDSHDLRRDEVRQLLKVMPGSRFVIAAREGVLGEGTRLRLAGLDPADALALVVQELGRPLAPEERAAA
jgi:hypothetical protein